jgi:hypothetical protein
MLDPAQERKRTLLEIVPKANAKKLAIKAKKGSTSTNGRRTHITSSSSFVRNVIAVPNLPARPVRPAKIKQNESRNQRTISARQGKFRTNAMHVGFYGSSHLEVDNKTNILHIDTTPSQIRGD